MITLHAGMIDDKTHKTHVKRHTDLHNTHNTLTKRSQQTRKQTNTHRRRTMRIQYTQHNNTFYKRINISNTFLKIYKLRKRENIYRLLQCLHFTGSKYLGTKLATSTS